MLPTMNDQSNSISPYRLINNPGIHLTLLLWEKSNITLFVGGSFFLNFKSNQSTVNNCCPHFLDFFFRMWFQKKKGNKIVYVHKIMLQSLEWTNLSSRKYTTIWVMSPINHMPTHPQSFDFFFFLKVKRFW